ncbi:YbaB/EbfC family nucleoid-associated protein [Actinokineospora xionganensis]|uniref:YbaB/EbfC family nucleoid-associated protein n=1 Tax=Actinokineospora xionganensis TaxID=2684470 RepID=A0ABR7L7E4_9PSEU|nr:YbaB/EbfC family nucleoid-associated protein [Actinokineospora xionganensis]MBC6448497.1 YbaB/EbfC family nucleoid-associated protein [Actinokineospora xionganensis]
MTGREPIRRSTKQLIEDGRARQEAMANIDTVLAGVRGTAYDNHQSVRVTVDGRGKLLELWLRQDAVRWGADQLGRLIVMVARAAMDQATQAGYNKLGPILGDNMTYAIELISGRSAPARNPQAGGISAEEFQRRRDERMANGPTKAEPAEDDGFDPDDPLSFDLSSLRSDR